MVISPALAPPDIPSKWPATMPATANAPTTLLSGRHAAGQVDLFDGEGADIGARVRQQSASVTPGCAISRKAHSESRRSLKEFGNVTGSETSTCEHYRG
jgi:hypothetical protein